MTHEEAARIRSELAAIQQSWLWQTYLQPWLEEQCAGLMAQALDPGHESPHTEARIRLDQMRRFQRYLASLQQNADETLAASPHPSLGQSAPAPTTANPAS
jgi:hypothetical protein